MNNSKSSYQKLKEEKLRLQQEILTIVNNPDSFDSQAILNKYRMQRDLGNLVWFGDTKKSEVISKGVYEQIREENITPNGKLTEETFLQYCKEFIKNIPITPSFRSQPLNSINNNLNYLQDGE